MNDMLLSVLNVVYFYLMLLVMMTIIGTHFSEMCVKQTNVNL